MFNWAVLIAPIALLLPTAAGVGAGAPHALGAADKAEPAAGERQDPRWGAFEPWTQVRPPQQVRIEQRVVVRIGPARPRASAFELQRAVPARMVERRMGKCVGISDILAVQTGPSNKLILFMRNRQMISARLEKACAARNFYSGFYVEPSRDGELCIKRDQLQSRNGTKCEVARFYRLEAADD